MDPFELALVVSLASQITYHLADLSREDIYNQLLIELRDLYFDTLPDVYISICWRLFSLYQLIHSGALAEWVSPAILDTRLPLPPAIIFVAANLPLNNKQGFDPQQFNKALEQCRIVDL